MAAHPAYLDGWARLAGLARDDVEAYAYARVGYHRGLDALRASGWRGSGYVRWEHPTNRGFLRALDALRAAAAAIGEEPEAQRCALFLRQLDPEWKSGWGRVDARGGGGGPIKPARRWHSSGGFCTRLGRFPDSRAYPRPTMAGDTRPGPLPRDRLPSERLSTCDIL